MSTQHTTDGQQTVNINGVELTVTPPTELPFPQNLAAGIIASRIVRKTESADPSTIDKDVLELCELCIDEQITVETLEGLGARDLSKILGAVYPDDVTDD